jgi:riboflavin kinase/FMN adenylyltransferase
MSDAYLGFDHSPNALGGAIAIGNFDGVHRGHCNIIDSLRQVAKKVDGPASIVTFDPPPARLLRPESTPKPLTTVAWKKELLAKAGADHVIVIPTTTELLQLTAIEFFERVVRGELQAKGIVEGENFRFGKGREGDIQLLASLCERHAMELKIATTAQCDGQWVSSTRIRQWIESGQMADANRYLLRPYRIAGKVVSGAQRGRTLGFPTANLDSIPVLVPSIGVYAARVKGVITSDGNPMKSAPIGTHVALNIGSNPTFGENALKVEAHLLGFRGDLYDAILELEILDRVRDVRKFESKESLLAQLANDLTMVASICQAQCNSI